MSKDSEIKNIEAISKAIDWHNSNCEFPAVKVLMNPIEVERLDWDSIKGVPIEAGENMGTGMFRIVCAGENNQNEESESTNADINEVVEEQRERELIPV